MTVIASCLGIRTLTAWRTRVTRQHAQVGAAFINNHDLSDGQRAGQIPKQHTLPFISFYRSERLFFRVQPSFCKARPIVLRLT